MATKFSPAKKSNKTPAVCRKGMFALPVVYVAGLPTSLTVFASSSGTSGYDPISQSFRLFWDAALARWRGTSAENGINIEVIVTPIPGDNNYEIEINIRDGQAVLDTFAWDDQVIEPGPPFDSGLLIRPAAGGDPEFQAHVIN